MAGVLSTAAQYLPQQDTSQLPDYSSDASKADLGSMAGTMQSAVTYTPDQNSLVSGQLDKLLSKDSDYLNLARTKAMQTAASRGLLNSSIAAGAGESAAIDAARPIAEGDASAYFTSQRDNAAAQNQFAQQANQFGRDAAMAKFKGVLDQAAQARDLNERRGEALVTAAGKDAELTQNQNQFDRDLAFRTDSTNRDLDLRQQQQDTQKQQFAQDLALRTNSANVDAALRGRQLDISQADLNQRAAQALQASRSDLAKNIATIRQQAMDAETRLESDPNMTADAKAHAIEAITTKASADIAELVRFTGLDLPSAWPDWINTDTSSGASKTAADEAANNGRASWNNGATGVMRGEGGPGVGVGGVGIGVGDSGSNATGTGDNGDNGSSSNGDDGDGGGVSV
jgi:hypothetical protein